LPEVLDCSGKTGSFDAFFSHIEHGCGLVAVQLSGGTGGTRLVYRESDHELVGGLIDGDSEFGICERNAYTTDNADLTHCPDYTICDICGPAMNALCSSVDLEEADAGM
jgi:hypothetical protein